MPRHFSLVLDTAAALAADSRAALLALWAQRRRHRWLYQPAHRKRRRP